MGVPVGVPLRQVPCRVLFQKCGPIGGGVGAGRRSELRWEVGAFLACVKSKL